MLENSVQKVKILVKAKKYTSYVEEGGGDVSFWKNLREIKIWKIEVHISLILKNSRRILGLHI